MSSGEDSHDTDRAQAKSHKKRRLRACDMCRRRKGDGGVMAGNTCSNCVAFKYKCTYVETAAKRVPDAGYIESLETQLGEMRKTLNKYRQLCPNIDFSDDPNKREETPVDGQSPFSEDRPQQSPRNAPRSCGSRLLSPVSVDAEDFDPSDDEVSARNMLAQGFENISLYPSHDHFLGKSSGLMFLQTALDMKQEYVSPAEGAEHRAPSRGGGSVPEGEHGQAGRSLMPNKRPHFWNEHPWMMRLVTQHRPGKFMFPDAELMTTLVDIYFAQINIYLPLLHRPTFLGGIRDGLHLCDVWFGCVVLLVCAIGARFYDDPRVLLEEETTSQGNGESPTKHSAGWMYFCQVQDMVRLLSVRPPRLYDLQIMCLAATYVGGTSMSHISWVYIGIGLRYAQDSGAHRKKVYKAAPSVEDELLKRAFWVLVFMDRLLSSVLGRPCAIQDEDFDVDLPVECDDEYWTNPDPSLAFKQPEGKPSLVTFFNCAIRLSQIHAFALRTIYSINKSKALLGFVGPQWEQHIVAELDSALNKWIDSVPDHLRWNPQMENTVFLNQSAHLYAAYYTIQITIHRPFIPSPRKPSGLSFPSLAICTNAARSCIHVLDVQARRVGVTSYLNQMALFSSGIVLLLNIWGAKRSGSVADPVKEMREVHKCMHMLKGLESSWCSAGRIWDILYDLANVGDLPLPDPKQSYKRPRGSESPTVASPTLNDPRIPQSRNVAGSRRVQLYQQQRAPAPSSDTEMFSLPIHSDELGRLPLHPFFAPQSVNLSLSPAHPAPSPHPSWLPQSFGPMPGTAEPPVAPPNLPNLASDEQIDSATLEAIFSMLPPVSYQQTVVPNPSQGSQAPAVYAGNVPPQHPPVICENFGNLMAHACTCPNANTNANIAPGMTVPVSPNMVGQGPGVPQETVLENNMLAMWSNVPSGFEWEDWGTYITNFGGSNQVHMNGADGG